MELQAYIILLSPTIDSAITIARRLFPYPNYEQFKHCFSIYLADTYMISEDKIELFKILWNFDPMVIDFISYHFGKTNYDEKRTRLILDHINKYHFFDAITFDKMWNRYLLFPEDSFKPFLIDFLLNSANLIEKILDRLAFISHIKVLNLVNLIRFITPNILVKESISLKTRIDLFIRVLEIMPISAVIIDIMKTLLITKNDLLDESILLRLTITGKIHVLIKLRHLSPFLLNRYANLVRKYTEVKGTQIAIGLSRYIDEYDLNIAVQIISKCSIDCTPILGSQLHLKYLEYQCRF